MTRTHLSLAFLLLLPLTVVRCGPPPKTTLRGQVFVSTKGGPAVKLPLVEVRAVPEKVVVELVARQQAETDSRVRASLDTYRTAREDCKQANARADGAKKAQDQYDREQAGSPR